MRRDQLIRLDWLIQLLDQAIRCQVDNRIVAVVVVVTVAVVVVVTVVVAGSRWCVWVG